MSALWVAAGGLGVGLVQSLFQNYEEIVSCFQSCQPWAIKVEKVLSYLIFMLGASKPGELIYRFIRRLLEDISMKYFGKTLDGNPNMEMAIQAGLSYFGQRKLEEVWDLVRDSSLCMRFNNCENEFFSSLNNMKLYYCDVEHDDEDWYNGKPLSACEQLFNDSPLLLLAGFVIVLFILSFAHMSNNPRQAPPGGNMTPYHSESGGGNATTSTTTSTGEPKHQTPEVNSSSSTNSSGETHQGSSGSTTKPSEPAKASTPASEPPKGPTTTEVSGPPKGSTSASEPPKGPSQPVKASISNTKTPQSSSGSGGGDGPPNPGDKQIVHSICPTCKIESTYAVPKPVPKPCKDCCDQHGASGSLSIEITKEEQDIIKAAIQRNVEELLDDLRKHLCPQCQKSFDERRRCVVALPVNFDNVCDNCEQNHR